MDLTRQMLMELKKINENLIDLNLAMEIKTEKPSILDQIRQRGTGTCDREGLRRMWDELDNTDNTQA
jgi:hypothetical protein